MRFLKTAMICMSVVFFELWENAVCFPHRLQAQQAIINQPYTQLPTSRCNFCMYTLLSKYL